jgi:capsular polysaccharide transport system permease protein
MLKQWLIRHIVLVLTVIAPTVVALVYFGLIASDVYVSEARFIVRKAQENLVQSSGGGIGDLLQSTGLMHSDDDTYLVHDYILSRDALRELDRTAGIWRVYSNHKIDVFSRFPGLDWNGSFENFHRYYIKRITVGFDATSSISVLTVRAYTAQDAQTINEQLLHMAEQLVNSLNERSRRDLIRFAANDVSVAAKKAEEANFALLAYRTRNSVYDPDKQAQVEFANIAKLEDEMIETETQVVGLTQMAPTNPQIVALKSRVDVLRDAITATVARVTHTADSLSVHSAEIDRLMVNLTFSDKLLGTALASLEEARSQAARQELYIDRLVQPNLPDYAMEPRRVRSIFTVFAVGLIAWGAASLVLAAIREHSA